MKLESVAGAIEYSKGQPIPGITGKVVKVWNQDEKSRTDGETYLKQGVVIADLNSPKTEITVNFYDHAAYDQSIVGKVITITPGPKGGLKSAGPWKEKHYLDCSKACDVTFDGPPAARPQAPAQRTALGLGTAAPQRNAPPANRGGMAWSEFIEAEGDVYAMCLKKAISIAKAHSDAVGVLCGSGFEPAHIISLTTTIRIAGEKMGMSVDSPTGSSAPARSHPPEDPGQSTNDDDIPM